MGVGRGYLNRETLTKERFIPDPLSGDPGARMYKSGDLGRWLPNGTVEFLGRNDFQVKIRGFRIELGEIEARLREYAGVREAVVLAREDAPGEKRLVAYYTVAAGSAVRVEGLKAHLSGTLASYMVPAAYVQLAALPLTVNGKLDRKALPRPEQGAYVSRQYEPAQGAVEQVLVGIWQELLSVPRVGRHDNFFELGGHSLLAIRVLERMRREGLSVDVRTLFLTPTLSELAQVTGQQNTLMQAPPNRIPAGCERITPELLSLVQLSQAEIDQVVQSVPGGAGNIQEIYGLTPLQEGILFHHLMAKEGDPYLSWTLMSFRNRQRLEEYVGALNEVIARHDILRTAVVWEGLSTPVQVVWREARLELEELELVESANNVETADVASQLRERLHPRRCRVAITQAPMMRMVVSWDAAQERWLAVWLVHHLVGDIASSRLLSQEIEAHLCGQTQQLSAPLPFREFVGYVRERLSRGDHEQFFRPMLQTVEEPTAPFGLLEVHGDGAGIQEASEVLASSLSRKLRQSARRLGVGVASLFHVAFGQLLSRASGREEPVFGTVVFGRMHGSEGVERVMGPFINTLPVKVSVRGVSVERCVRETHQLLAQLLLHEHAPLAEVQQYSQVPAPAPLFTALLNYVHSISAAQLLQVSMQGQDTGVQYLASEERTNYPLTVSVNDYGEELQLVAQVESGVGAARVCAMMVRVLEELVSALEKDPGQAVDELQVLPEAEREQVLREWNATQRPYPQQQCIQE
jgi:aryl carrier-like protein